jgi:hypothetical protein
MKWLYLIVGLALGALAHFAYSGANMNPGVRTDLTIYRDAETGCEYLKPAWSFSGLTPRNDSLGVPICKDEGVDEKVEQLLDDIGNGNEDEATPQGAPPMPIAPPVQAPSPAPSDPGPAP